MLKFPNWTRRPCFSVVYTSHTIPLEEKKKISHKAANPVTASSKSPICQFLVKPCEQASTRLYNLRKAQTLWMKLWMIMSYSRVIASRMTQHSLKSAYVSYKSSLHFRVQSKSGWHPGAGPYWFYPEGVKQHLSPSSLIRWQSSVDVNIVVRLFTEASLSYRSKRWDELRWEMTPVKIRIHESVDPKIGQRCYPWPCHS